MHSQIHVVNRRTHRAKETVYIGRGSIWGNHSRIGRDGNRGEVIAKYRYQLWSMLKTRELTLEDLRSLQGQVLGCYCKPAACHGDVLIEASNWAVTETNLDPAEIPYWVLATG